MIKDNIVRGNNGIICRLCGKMIKQMSNMRRHFRDKHDSPVVYNCPECRRSYNGKNGFQTHIYRTHPQWKGVNVDSFLASSN